MKQTPIDSVDNLNQSLERLSTESLQKDPEIEKLVYCLKKSDQSSPSSNTIVTSFAPPPNLHPTSISVSFDQIYLLLIFKGVDCFAYFMSLPVLCL